MVSKKRNERINERIHQVISEILLREVSDPRLVGVNVTDVSVDRELNFADIYVSAIEGSQRSSEILEGLHHAQGYLRSELASRVDLRIFPYLRFHWDPTPENADRMELLFKKIRQEREGNPGTEQGEGPK